MNIFSKVLVAAALTTAATGCSSFLDINDNPNQQTATTPDAILATALVTTASNYTGGATNYNSYGSFVAGYWSRSGTVSAFAEEQTYNYSTTYYQNLWTQTYDNLNDYNIIQTTGATTYPNHAAIARIMKVYNYLLLVDEYGDIPYTNALQGAGNITPAYDKADAIYKDLIVQLRGAVADIAAAASSGGRVVGTEDVVFGGGTAGMQQWRRFANSLQLRILLRQSSTTDATLNAYVTAQMAALQAAAPAVTDYISADVVVQPGYAANTNQQNPFYNRYGFGVGLTNATSEYSFVIPTNYILNQYRNNRDSLRMAQLYRLGQRTITPTGGTAVVYPRYVGGTLGESNPYTFTGANIASRFLQSGTFLRSPSAPTVLMLRAEHLFSKAEAELRGLLPGGDGAANSDYLAGIQAAYVYTYRTATDRGTVNAAVTANTAGVAQSAAYITANSGNGLVDWTATTTTVPDGIGTALPRTVTKQEKILYQKYLAENTVASIEAWDDYRRTAQPKFMISLRAGTNPLPRRLFYPQTELNLNAANVPAGVTQNTRIFWQFQ
ncbi:MAG: SusD/RagB family nutrient-binding outer membrane lipoprotein [Hymenobacter sp.]|nr:MAG: SusD/RagB family nutrient-binding outer membrane lipoprotein [Hymenobacter sp.]